MSEVEYRDIPGYPRYRAGDDGSIWGNNNKEGVWIKFQPQINSGKCTSKVTLRNLNGIKRWQVFKLVLSAFNIEKKEYDVCFFINGDINDNSLSNLKYIDSRNALDEFGQPNGDTRYMMLKNHPGYCVGEDGSIWSIFEGKARHTLGWNKIKCNKRKDGYYSLTFKENGENYKEALHRLVLETFTAQCPDGQECLHGDGNPSNNSLSNLRWGTHKENAQDTDKHGRIARGERSGMAKLKTEEVIEIKKLLQLGKSTIVIGKLFNISSRAIRCIRNGETWTHIQLEKENNE